MSILNNILPATSSAIAHQNVNAGAARPGSAGSQNAIINGAINSGQAAIVSLSAKKREPSHGESKFVDASFEKQEIKEEVAKKEEKVKTTAGKSVDVSA